jgi:hypothetical protein
MGHKAKTIHNKKIWGFWTEDETAYLIGENRAKLINEYVLRLDIICDDPRFDFEGKYFQIYFWNSTIN